tara:strand:+ start:504 stop:1025 length:522 start_codon:yes stop_codon:yes gene_type:complete
MASIKLQGDTSGELTISAPAVAGTNTLTLPASTGTLMVTGPAFSAVKSGNQTVTANTTTKVTFQTKEFDTNTNFDNTTNYRFTPTVAGYYQVSGSFQQGGSGEVLIILYKNGSAFKNGNWLSSTVVYAPIFSTLVYFNGSTDYIEMYAYTGATGTTIFAGNSCYFQASMVRSV